MARAEFPDLVKAAEDTTDPEHAIVTKHSRNVVAIVPMEWYRRASAALGEPTEL